jgi:hypothetical protein
LKVDLKREILTDINRKEIYPPNNEFEERTKAGGAKHEVNSGK